MPLVSAHQLQERTKGKEAKGWGQLHTWSNTILADIVIPVSCLWHQGLQDNRGHVGCISDVGMHEPRWLEHHWCKTEYEVREGSPYT